MKKYSVALLIEEMDDAWKMLISWCEGLTDGEFFWEPVSNCWTVHLQEDGQWVVDYEISPPDPPPLTTIAWKIAHLHACKLMYYEYAFGDGKLIWDEIEIPHNATEALTMLEGAHRQLSRVLDDLDETDMERMVPTNWGEQWPIWRIFWVMILHDLTHGAEIGCLRDLYGVMRAKVVDNS